VETERLGERRPARRRPGERSVTRGDRTGLNRLDFLKRATALVVATRLRWIEQAFAAAPTTRQTIDALVAYVVPGKKVLTATAPRVIRTLDRFLPGPLPLSATAASILNGGAAQVRPGASFAQLSRAEKARVFETVEQLPDETAGSIRFLVGNLADLTAFLAYSSAPGRKLARFSPARHGHKEFKGYW
jgi:hypothetical protein